jgi:TonB family protein
MRSLVILLALAAAPCVAQTPADSGRVYELNEVEVLPRPQNAADFAAALRTGYPPQLSQAGVGGTVQVSFVVGPDGVPGDVRVVSSPDPAFHAPSVQAVSLLRFSPAQVQGRAVPVRVDQPITWRAEPVADVTGRGVAAGGPPVRDSINGYELIEVETLPRLLDRRAFGRALAQAYPPALRDVGVQGTVQVRFRVETDGTVSSAAVTHSTDPRFNQATLQAVQTMRFRPAEVNGRPVRVWVEQPIQWTVSMAPPPAEATRRRGQSGGAYAPPPHCGTYTQC